jgi:hypothetical protein
VLRVLTWVRVFGLACRRFAWTCCCWSLWAHAGGSVGRWYSGVLAWSAGWRVDGLVSLPVACHCRSSESAGLKLWVGEPLSHSQNSGVCVCSTLPARVPRCPASAARVSCLRELAASAVGVAACASCPRKARRQAAAAAGLLGSRSAAPLTVWRRTCAARSSAGVTAGCQCHQPHRPCLSRGSAPQPQLPRPERLGHRAAASESCVVDRLAWATVGGCQGPTGRGVIKGTGIPHMDGGGHRDIRR